MVLPTGRMRRLPPEFCLNRLARRRNGLLLFGCGTSVSVNSFNDDSRLSGRFGGSRRREAIAMHEPPP